MNVYAILTAFLRLSAGLCTFVCVLTPLFGLAGCGDGEQVYEGELEATDARLKSDGSPYDWFVIDLEQGDVVDVSVRSDDFDTTLFFFNPDRRQLLEQPGTSGMASLQYQATVEGRYAVMINAKDPDAAGHYAISLSVRSP